MIAISALSIKYHTVIELMVCLLGTSSSPIVPFYYYSMLLQRLLEISYLLNGLEDRKRYFHILSLSYRHSRGPHRQMFQFTVELSSKEWLDTAEGKAPLHADLRPLPQRHHFEANSDHLIVLFAHLDKNIDKVVSRLGDGGAL